MKRTFGKLITIFLCLTMLLSLLPLSVLASSTSTYPTLDSLPNIDSDSLGDIIDDLGKLPSVGATPTPADPQGACGVSMSWHITGGVLTVSGNGAMYDYSGTNHAPWYAYRGTIKSVVVELGVPNIGAYAFEGLTNLTSVDLSETIETVGTRAFAECVKLAEIDLPDSINEIGSAAFEGCTALTKVTLPANVHKAADSLFYGCTSLTEVIFPEGETELGASVFDGCTALSTVVYRDVTKIGAGAFRGCTNMTVFNFPDTLTSIGKDAFSGSGLKMLKLPKGLTDIACLEGTDKLTTVFIPASVKNIESGQFAVCKDLKQVDYEGSKLDWKNIRIGDNNDMLQNAEFTYNRTDSFLYAEVVTTTPAPTAAPTPTPNTGCTTHDYAFNAVAPTCTEDGYGELVCTVCGAKRATTQTDPVAVALTDIFTRPIDLFDYPEYIPSRINPLFFDDSDDYGDFKDVPAAEYEAVMAEYFVVTDELLDELRNHTEFKVESDCLTYDASTDTYRISKTGGWGGWINGPVYQGYAVSGSTYEVYYAEAEYVYLNDVLPEGTNMYDYWEEQGDPESLDYAGYTFTLDPEGTPVCLAKVLTNGKKGIAEKDGDTYRIVDIVDYTEADLPDSLVIPDFKALGHDYVDGKCTRCGLTDGAATPEPTAAPTPTVKPVTTPTVTPVPQGPNGKCGDNLTWSLNEEKGILTISGTGAMYDYDLYEGEMAPWHEYSDVIAYVWIEDGITALGAVAFADMKFGSIVIPDGITTLPAGIFLGTPLNWISLPESLKTIELRALECYSNLGSAFGTIATMSQVHFRGTKDQWFTIEIDDHNRIDGADMYYNSKYLKTPYGCSGPCGDTSTWNYDIETKTMTISGTGAAINDTWQGVVSSMVSSSNIKHAVIEEGITSIGGLFNQHDSLKTVTIAGTVKTIGPDAFYSCGALEEVTLSEGIESIGEDAFGECSKLNEIVIPEGVTTIGMRAFAQVPLKKLTLPATLTTVEYNAFRYCGQLKTVHFNGTEADWKANVTLEEGNEVLTSAAMTFGNQPRPTVTPDVTPNVTPGVDPTVKPTVTTTPAPYIPATPSPNPNLDPETCKHTLFFVAPQDATCTEDGFTGKVICGNGCGHVLQEGKVKPALGHNYKSGTCTRCGHIEGTPEPTPIPPVAEGTPFVDLTTEDWFYEPVRWAVETGITGGTSENTFSPDKTCTRAQIVTFLWAAAGKPEPTSKSPFYDVKEGDWYYDAVIWAVENDITSGTSIYTFSPDIPCSRAQVVALLYKAMEAPNVETTELSFTDVAESDYFHKAVCWAVENGIASGVSAEVFGSTQPCTRAQIAMFLYKAYNK